MRTYYFYLKKYLYIILNYLYYIYFVSNSNFNQNILKIVATNRRSTEEVQELVAIWVLIYNTEYIE